MNIYGVSGVRPEVLAYGMARYSRSSRSMADVLSEIDQDKAGDFLETFYYQYGHASIADMAHVALGIEDVSILAAMEIVDEALWDGQERSTRYQDFSKPRYYRPENADPAYDEMMKRSFRHYTEATDWLIPALRHHLPQPASMSTVEYSMTVRAKAFDIARYFLPLGTLTSLGQITSARTLSRQIARLKGYEYPEIIKVAEEMQVAAQSKVPLRLDDAGEDPLLPTLVRHTNPSPWGSSRTFRASSLFEESGLRKLADAEDKAAAAENQALSVDIVELCALDDLDAMLAVSFYEVTHHRLRSILSAVWRLNRQEKSRMLDLIFETRGAHDEWPAALALAPLAVDITIDVGGYRDLNRHRRLRKVRKPLTYVEDAKFGIDLPIDIIGKLDLGVMVDALKELTDYSDAVSDWPIDANNPRIYLRPLATNTRALFLMDYAQAAYMIEFRSKPTGHFSYRKVMQEFHERLLAVAPQVAKHIRVSPQPWDQITLER